MEKNETDSPPHTKPPKLILGRLNIQVEKAKI